MAGETQQFNWARLNPFAKADRGELSPPSPQQIPNTNQNQNKDTSGFVPDNTNRGKKHEGEDDPLLNFSDLWEPNKDKDGKPIPDKDNNNSGYIPQLDPKKFGDMVSKIDFSKTFTPEEMEAVKTGGDGAVAAIASMINKATRQSFQVSLAAATRLAEQGFTNAKERFQSEIPDHVRNHMLDNDLNADPLFKNPALQPVVRSVKDQYLKKFPKATPSELNNAVKQYFKYIGGEINKPPEKNEDDPNVNKNKLRQGAADADFMDWLGKEVLESRTGISDIGNTGADTGQT